MSGDPAIANVNTALAGAQITWVGRVCEVLLDDKLTESRLISRDYLVARIITLRPDVSRLSDKTNANERL